MSTGQTLAKAAMLENKHVTYLPSYGAEVRGGTANCTVTISDDEIASPIASQPDFIVALNQPSFFRFQNLLPSGGFMLFNSSLVEASSARGDIETLGIPITRLATDLGNVKVANMIMLGAFIRLSNLISFDLNSFCHYFLINPSSKSQYWIQISDPNPGCQIHISLYFGLIL